MTTVARIIRLNKDTAVSEVLRYYFYLIGYIFWDYPCNDITEIYERLNIFKGKKYNIVLLSQSNIDKELIIEKKNKSYIYVKYKDIPKEGNRSKFFLNMINGLIDNMFSELDYSDNMFSKLDYYNGYTDKMINRVIEQLKYISKLYIDYDLFSYLDTSITMNEMSSRLLYKGGDKEMVKELPIIMRNAYVSLMLITFNKIYNLLENKYPVDDENNYPCLFTRYAKANLKRKYKNLYDYFWFNDVNLPGIDEDLLLNIKNFNREYLYTKEDYTVDYKDSYDILNELFKCDKKDIEYPSIYYQAAKICLYETALENYGMKYLIKFARLIKDIPYERAMALYTYGEYWAYRRHHPYGGNSFFEEALKGNPYDYMSCFQIGFYEMRAGKTLQDKTRHLYKAQSIITNSKDFDHIFNHVKDNLSLYQLECLYKINCWLYLILKNYEENYSYPFAAMKQICEIYEKNIIMNKIYDNTSSKEIYFNYHINSYPLKLMKRRLKLF